MLLAAGVGRRLGQAHRGPKSLLRFGGRSLLRRHLESLHALGLREIVLCTGHEAALLEAEVAASGLGHLVRLVHNPRYSRGSAVSMWCALAAFEPDTTLLMDADVLYDPRILERLARTQVPNCFLLDRDFLPGEEPVKLCLRQGTLVEFRKRLPPDLDFDVVGESVGFFRFEPSVVRELTARAAAWLEGGRLDEPHEEIIRDLMLERPEAFGVEDVTGLAWVEIDFPEDIERAERQVLPRIEEQA